MQRLDDFLLFLIEWSLKMSGRFTFVFVIVSLAVVLVCLAWGWWSVPLGELLALDTQSVSLGDWGDSFAALNTAFSGLAFVGIAATIYLQIQVNKKHKIDLQKGEFERTFFQIFGLIRELRKELVFSSPASRRMSRNAFNVPASGSFNYNPKPEKPKVGSEAMKAAYHEIKSSLLGSVKDGDLADYIVRVYEVKVNRHCEAEFSPYFRAIYSLLKRIDQAYFLDENEKLEYSRLLRSQMNSYEAIILGVNGLTVSSKDLKAYVERFRMLKYAKEGEVKELLKSKYSENTFISRSAS